MQLTAKEEKIARLALDKGAQSGEREAAAIKLINSLQARGITVEDIEKVLVREKVVVLKVAMPTPQPTVVRKAPSPAPRPAYIAPKPTPEPAKKDIPVWRQVAALLIVAIAMILLFAGLGRQPPRDSASAQSLPSSERTASAQLSPLPVLTALAQVSPSPEPTVRRARLVTPNETHAKRHPKD